MAEGTLTKLVIFFLEVPHKGQYWLTISSVGFVTVSKQVSISTNELLSITLSEDVQMLGAVTVVGRKKIIAINSVLNVFDGGWV